MIAVTVYISGISNVNLLERESSDCRISLSNVEIRLERAMNAGKNPGSRQRALLRRPRRVHTGARAVVIALVTPILVAPLAVKIE